MAVEARDIERAFERAAAVVGRLTGEAPFASADAAIARARALLGALAEHDRIAVLDAHPRIGADRRTLSPDSAREQGPDEDPAVDDELGRLNVEYERRFGFRFVVYVAGRRRRDILPVLRRRLARSREAELAAGIDEFLAIARDRLGR